MWMSLSSVQSHHARSKHVSVDRMIGRTSLARDLSAIAKRRVVHQLMAAPSTTTSFGAKQYMMARALRDAQKKVQPVANILGEEGLEDFPPRKLTWVMPTEAKNDEIKCDHIALQTRSF